MILHYRQPFNLHIDFWKSRSWEIKAWPVSNLRKISRPAQLNFFQFITWIFFTCWRYKSSFFTRGDQKTIQVCRSWFFKTLIFRTQSADKKAECRSKAGRWERLENALAWLTSRNQPIQSFVKSYIPKFKYSWSGPGS